MSCKNNVSRGCCFSVDPATGEPKATYKSGCQKMDVYDWIGKVDNPRERHDVYEVQFKNTRKGYYVNPGDVVYKKGDVVVVESTPGVNVGVVTMCSDMVSRQMRRKGFNPKECEFPKVLRYPNVFDIQRWEEAIALEHQTMIKSRQICARMGLDMKLGDVEYQADKMKAIFYYIADGRVDFRELIKVLAEQFRIRIEMKQVGSRQEAGLIGGIAACGRELCCSTWYNNFSTVVISAARIQDISPNPQKLAGQCGKLKCCLNYELDSYVDAREKLPRVYQPLESQQADYFLVKTDVLRGIMYFSPDPKNPVIQVPLTSERVRFIQSLNKKGQKVDEIAEQVKGALSVVEEPDFENVVGQDSLTRFDKSKNNRNRKKRPVDSPNGDRRSTENEGQIDRQSQSAQQLNGEPKREGGERQNNERRSNNRNRNRNRADARTGSERQSVDRQGGSDRPVKNDGGSNDRMVNNKVHK